MPILVVSSSTEFNSSKGPQNDQSFAESVRTELRLKPHSITVLERRLPSDVLVLLGPQVVPFYLFWGRVSLLK